MNRKQSHLIGILIVGLVLASAYVVWSRHSWSSSQSFRVVVRGSTKSNDHIRISGGNLVVVAPEPGMFFGTVRRPGESEQFTYLILFEYGHSAKFESHHVMKSICTSEGRVAETRNSLELNGKQIEADYRLKMTESLSAVEQESLTIGGKTVDVSLGRVFLVDLSDERQEYSQRRIELPVIDSELETTEDVERLAETVKTILNRDAGSHFR